MPLIPGHEWKAYFDSWLCRDKAGLDQRLEGLGMRCLSCGFENPEGTKFCEECGTKLVRVCPSCGHEVRPTAKFCGECGTSFTGQAVVSQTPHSGPRTPDPRVWTPPHLAERILAEQAAMEARGATDGERKTITALFVDIKGSTALIEDLDPEEARSIIDPALQLMMDAVHRYDGYVAQALGDGIFALFGAPIAHEDHPQRALLCGPAHARGNAAVFGQAAVKRWRAPVYASGG